MGQKNEQGEMSNYETSVYETKSPYIGHFVRYMGIRWSTSYTVISFVRHTGIGVYQRSVYGVWLYNGLQPFATHL